MDDFNSYNFYSNFKTILGVLKSMNFKNLLNINNYYVNFK